MMIPEFIRFYSYSASQVLEEYAVRFFSLVNSMYQLKASESLDSVMQVSTGMNGNKEYLSALQKQQKGIAGIVEEVRIVKRNKDVN
jgi:hypothetical protein